MNIMSWLEEEERKIREERTEDELAAYCEWIRSPYLYDFVQFCRSLLEADNNKSIDLKIMERLAEINSQQNEIIELIAAKKELDELGRSIQFISSNWRGE